MWAWTGQGGTEPASDNRLQDSMEARWQQPDCRGSKSVTGVVDRDQAWWAGTVPCGGWVEGLEQPLVQSWPTHSWELLPKHTEGLTPSRCLGLGSQEEGG